MLMMQSIVDPNQYLQAYLSSFPALKPQYNTTAIGELFSASDFIAIASRPSLTTNFSVEELEDATSLFETELMTFNVNLTALQTMQVPCFPMLKTRVTKYGPLGCLRKRYTRISR